MKNLIKLLALLIVLASCNTEKAKIDTNIEHYLKRNTNYEPLSTRFNDTIFVLDGINRNIECFIDNCDLVKKFKAEKDSILSSVNPNPIIGYSFIHEYEVDLGIKIQIEVITDKEFNIITTNEVNYIIDQITTYRPISKIML